MRIRTTMFTAAAAFFTLTGSAEALAPADKCEVANFEAGRQVQSLPFSKNTVEGKVIGIEKSSWRNKFLRSDYVLCATC